MIKWWKGIFDDLTPYSIMSMENVFERYLEGLKSFGALYYDQYREGSYFINISRDHLIYKEARYFHEKFNSPFCNFNEYRQRGKDDHEPRKKLLFHLEQNRQFAKPEHQEIKFSGNTSNYNGRDGQIRGGFATPNFFKYYIKPKQNKIIDGNWVYLEIPYELTYNHLKETNNGVEIEIAKQFVNEVEASIGWDDIEEIKKVVDIYDNKHPGWNHDFPINGFIQMKNDGLLFPAVWVDTYKLLYHSFHRLIMTSFNKMNFPFIIPTPYNKRKWTGQSASKNFFHQGEYKFLNFHINLDSKKTEFEFSTQPLPKNL